MLGAIIQARIGSTRLPHKILLKLAGKTVLEHVIERVHRAKKIGRVVVATTNKPEDDKVLVICQKLAIDYFRGSENDVLDRYYWAAQHFGFSDIVRITSDCPMIDPEIIDKLIGLYQKEKLDYAVNSIPPSFPDGLDVEVFSFKALEKAWRQTKWQSQREHVTLYIWQNPHLFKQKRLKSKVNLSGRRWVLDEPEDYQFMKKVFNQLYPVKPRFRLADLLKFFKENPEIEKINQHIKRNEGLDRSLKEDKPYGQ